MRIPVIRMGMQTAYRYCQPYHRWQYRVLYSFVDWNGKKNDLTVIQNVEEDFTFNASDINAMNDENMPLVR